MDTGQQNSFNSAPVPRDASLAECQGWLPGRTADSNKGDNGRVLIVGGDYSMAGAAGLAGWSAYISGAGLVRIATRSQNVGTITAFRPELLVYAIDDAIQLGSVLSAADSIAIGPGLGQSRWSRDLFEYVLEHAYPQVIDADGLNLLATEKMRRDWVLTPHPGEAARLLNCDVNDIQADRQSAAVEIAGVYGGVCVLKGRGTLVATAGQPVVICPYGNEALAVAGTGDVLTGAIAGLLAQGMDTYRAAITAVVLHACAADRYAEYSGKIGMLASDLIRPMRDLRNKR